MGHRYISAALVMLLAGCGPGSSSSHKTPNPEVDAQLFKLAHMNGCIECHTVSATTVGPSWMAIAERYKAAPVDEARALLVDSVMKGSKGKWPGWKNAEGMPPLERRVAREDVVQLVNFILSLNRS